MSFERTGVVFNIAAMYSKLALAQDVHTDQGHKMAAQLLQQSAGTLSFLLEQLGGPNGWGVSEKGEAQLKSLLNLELAQAQELFLQKAIQGIINVKVVTNRKNETAFVIENCQCCL